MRINLNSLLFSSLLLSFPATELLAAQSNNEVQEYCQSLAGSGLSEEDLRAFMSDCITEQSSYFEQEAQSESYEESTYEESSYQEPSDEAPSEEPSSYDQSMDEQQSYEDSYQEPQYEQDEYSQEQNCYSKVDEHIQKLLDNDPNMEFDYDQLVDQCLKGNL